MPDHQPKLTRLATLVATLNTETDALTERIEQFEDDLRRSNVGLEAWCPIPGSNQQLGYSKLDKNWGLALRPASQEDTTVPHALRHSPRHVRVAAVECFDDLLDALTQNAQELLDATVAASKKLKS